MKPLDDPRVRRRFGKIVICLYHHSCDKSLLKFFQTSSSLKSLVIVRYDISKLRLLRINIYGMFFLSRKDEPPFG